MVKLPDLVFQSIGFTNFGKSDLSQSTSTRIGVTDSIHLTEFYLKVSPFGEELFSVRVGNFTTSVVTW